MIILKLIRIILGEIILFFSAVFKPSQIQTRSPEEQSRVDEQTKALTLYKFRRCPFCVKVKRHLKRLRLNMVTRDILKHKQYEAELISGGGKRKVPCLRIEEKGSVKWLYESSDINAYLTEHFA